jgi:phosphate transport system protein
MRAGSPKGTPPPEFITEPVRASFASALEQLKVQVEMMALRVDVALQSSAQVLLTGDLELANEVIRGDDDIDSMFVSLTERCYELLGRQAPVASDLRLVVSVLGVVQDLERSGDLCLRIVRLAPDHHLLSLNPETFSILKEMARVAIELFGIAIRSFSSQDLRLAHSLEQRDDAMDACNARLTEAIFAMEGRGVVPQAVQTLLAGRALERIADHSVLVGERLRYLLTGDLGSLSKQIGP